MSEDERIRPSLRTRRTIEATFRFGGPAVAELTALERQKLHNDAYGRERRQFSAARKRLREACDADPVHAHQGCDAACDGVDICRIYVARLNVMWTAKRYAAKRAEALKAFKGLR